MWQKECDGAKEIYRHMFWIDIYLRGSHRVFEKGQHKIIGILFVWGKDLRHYRGPHRIRTICPFITGMPSTSRESDSTLHQINASKYTIIHYIAYKINYVSSSKK